MTLNYREQVICGTPHLVLSDQTQQNAFILLTGKKTITPSHIEALTTLGFKMVKEKK